MTYKGYLIYTNDYRHKSYPQVDFLFHNLDDCDELQGTGENIKDCKEQIDELIENRRYV